MTSLDKCIGGVPIGEMIVIGTSIPSAPMSSTDYWIDNYFTINLPESLLTHELEPARIEPSKLFLKLMERI